jgi:hypothetical protein
VVGQRDTIIPKELVNYQVYKRFHKADLQPTNPTLVSSKPTGPFEYAVSKKTGTEFLLLFEEEGRGHRRHP